ncbi:DUF427 domain-containing protein [Aestuariibius sp. 2305UL40-4]|uniref:DUF427 domain-containing protein n=1 Tax=Aestuariibius violaceus TaxID=3234132 RepID=UPI00345EC323
MALARENVQDYPRPPALERVDMQIAGEIAGEVLFDVPAAWRVLETHHAPTYYLPLDAFPEGALTPTGRQTFCEWKGRAAYFDLTLGGRRVSDAAWTYPEPTRTFAALKDHVSIYAHALDRITVDGVPVTPQPGDFYGGWVTPNLDGIVKGGPGTEWW